jgi:hypothetical protein
LITDCKYPRLNNVDPNSKMINDHSLNEYIKGMIDLDSFVEMPSDRSNRGSFILIDSENNSFE